MRKYRPDQSRKIRSKISVHLKLPKLEPTNKKQVNLGSKDKLRLATISGDAFIAMVSTFLHKMTIVRTVTRKDGSKLNPL